MVHGIEARSVPVIRDMLQLFDTLSSLSHALGLDLAGEELGAGQMVLRAAIVYGITLLLLRAGKKRFMGQHTALDIVMIIVLGSVISRAVNGSAPFWPTVAASLALIAAHRITAWVAVHSKAVAHFAEGDSTPLMRDGKLDREAMRHHDITERDLRIAMRSQLHTEDLHQARDVYLEPNGKFSIVKADGAQG